MILLSLARSLSLLGLPAVCLAGCATQLPQFDTNALDTKLNELSCVNSPDSEQCRKAFEGDGDKARELRLLRAYLLLEGAARYGAARFTTYSDAPADDAFQLMGHISSAVSALGEAEGEYAKSADAKLEFKRQTGYPVDRTVALLRVVAAIDSASKPVLRGVTGMLALNSNVDRIKNAVKIVKNVGEDTLFASAYQQAVTNMVAMQTNSGVAAPYRDARTALLSRINDRCRDLARLANSKEHSCGEAVKSAGEVAPPKTDTGSPVLVR
jgi:hypothetical protein